MRVLLTVPALLPLLLACASSNPRAGTPTARTAGPAAPPPVVTTTRVAPPEHRGTTDPGTRWMPVQPVGALAAETEPMQPQPEPHARPALMPGTPPGTPAEWTTPPPRVVEPQVAPPLGDPPAGTGLSGRRDTRR